MKQMNNIETFTDKEWEELASCFSEEHIKQSNKFTLFMAEDPLNTEKQWNELREMRNEKKIDVDRAWENVLSKLNVDGLISKTPSVQKKLSLKIILRVAAVALIVLSLVSAVIYLNNNGTLSQKITFATNIDQKNLQVKLPDGSNVYLNRNTKISYRTNFGRNSRNITLSGEAFFEITTDAIKPFIIDAGKARIKVLGTSFNVITENDINAVEVFVKSGKVMLYEDSGSSNLILEPGYIGTMDSKQSRKLFNNNPNYMSWNTGLLVYNGQKLNVVFNDLKRVYNMDIVANDPGILEETWTSPIDNLQEETIIRLICTSFNLSYSKDGNIYHLDKK
jgi:transmembrane sensor